MEPVTGNVPAPAPKGRRFASAIVDLMFVPTFLGIPVGIILALLAIQDPLLSVLLALVNLGWLVFRDAVFSPGRQYNLRRILSVIYLFMCAAGIIFGAAGGQPVLAALSVLAAIFPACILLFDKPGAAQDLKIVSLTSPKVTVGQALIRNLLIGIPYVLIIGYPVEIIFLLIKGERLSDSWAKTRIVPAA